MLEIDYVHLKIKPETGNTSEYSNVVLNMGQGFQSQRTYPKVNLIMIPKYLKLGSYTKLQGQ